MFNLEAVSLDGENPSNNAVCRRRGKFECRIVYELCGWLVVRFDEELMIEEVWTKVFDGSDNGKKLFFPYGIIAFRRIQRAGNESDRSFTMRVFLHQYRFKVRNHKHRSSK